MKHQSYVTATDGFCGAGGSCIGATDAGMEVKIALNHWKLAIETHSKNFPNIEHDCTDISACDPRRYPSTTVGIFSPECTTHSPAGGTNHKALKKQMDLFNTGKVDASTERSRMTMWDVWRFAEYHEYKCLIIENVVEVVNWGLFDVWLMAAKKLGYDFKLCSLNSMHFFPTPQSRDRLYIVFWKRELRKPDLDFTPVAYCPHCSKNVNSIQTWKKRGARVGKYNKQYIYNCPQCSKKVEPYYYAAFNVIDWSNIGTRIGDRDKPLSPNTMRRIEHGKQKYWQEPFVIQTANDKNDWHRSKSIGEAMFTQTTFQSQGLVQPFLIDSKQHSGLGCRLRSVGEAVNTIHTDPRLTLIHAPFITTGEHSMVEPESYVHSSTQPFSTQATRQTKALVTAPFLTILRGESNTLNSSDALNTVTAGGPHTGIVTPEAFKSFLTYFYHGDQSSSITEAVDSVTTKERALLISYDKPDIQDCYYRMLQHEEVKLAMAFPKDYAILGTSKQKVKQCGNAVTPPAMKYLCNQVAAIL